MRLAWLPLVVLALATPAWCSDYDLLAHLSSAEHAAESLLSLIYNRFEVTRVSPFLTVLHVVYDCARSCISDGYPTGVGFFSRDSQRGVGQPKSTAAI